MGRTSDKLVRPDRTMNVREFLRGGYGRDRGGITVVMNGGVVEGIWLHGGAAIRVELPVPENGRRPRLHGSTGRATRQPGADDE